MDMPNLSGSCIWDDSLREVHSGDSGVGRLLVIASSAADSASPCRRNVPIKFLSFSIPVLLPADVWATTNHSCKKPATQMRLSLRDASVQDSLSCQSCSLVSSRAARA